MATNSHTHIITVKTNFTNDRGQYWIRVRKNNQYFPRKPNFPITETDHEDNEWHTVSSVGKIREKPIFYWVVETHNLFDHKNLDYHMYFIEPDVTRVENMDQNNYMALNQSGNLQLLHSHLKYNGMKMHPTFYIARNIGQIETALKFVKYCVVKVENNEQKLYDA